MRHRIVLAGLFCMLPTLLAAQPLSEKTFTGYMRYLAPKPAELAWEKVDWHASYWDGVLEGHKQKKPILVWAMNGHPLGCT
jgi:hypothetical protein